MAKRTREIPKVEKSEISFGTSSRESPIKESLHQHNNIALSQDLIIHHIPGYFLLFGILIAFYLIYILYQPFWTVLIMAGVLVTAFYPFYEWILKVLRGRSAMASLLSCFSIILIIVIPLVIFISLIAVQGVEAYKVIEQKIQIGVLDPYLKWEKGGMIYDFKERVLPALHLESVDVKKGITETAQKVSTFLVTQSAEILRNVVGLIINFVIMVFALYYFFKDGEKFVGRVIDLSPLPAKYETVILTKLQSMTKAIFYGIFLTAIIQGFVGGIGFTIAGISNSMFWGAVMAFCSLMPFVGTSVVWFPAAVVLFALGHYPQAIFLLIWGFVVISSIDNIIRPMLIGGKARTYPLLIFLSIFGGIIVFGLKGLIFGPLILVFALTFLDIYELEYHDILKR